MQLLLLLLQALLLLGFAHAQPCARPAKLDIIWLLDYSYYTMDMPNNGVTDAFANYTAFIKDFTQSQLVMSESAVRQAFITFSGQLVGFPTYTDIGDVLSLGEAAASGETEFFNRLDEIGAMGGSVNHPVAVARALQMLQDTPKRAGSEQAVILLGSASARDGEAVPNSLVADTNAAISQLKSATNAMFIVIQVQPDMWDDDLPYSSADVIYSTLDSDPQVLASIVESDFLCFTQAPSRSPSASPSSMPSPARSTSPSLSPSASPSLSPSASPSLSPSFKLAGPMDMLFVVQSSFALGDGRLGETLNALGKFAQKFLSNEADGAVRLGFIEYAGSLLASAAGAGGDSNNDDDVFGLELEMTSDVDAFVQLMQANANRSEMGGYNMLHAAVRRAADRVVTLPGRFSVVVFVLASDPSNRVNGLSDDEALEDVLGEIAVLRARHPTLVIVAVLTHGYGKEAGIGNMGDENVFLDSAVDYVYRASPTSILLQNGILSLNGLTFAPTTMTPTLAPTTTQTVPVSTAAPTISSNTTEEGDETKGNDSNLAVIIAPILGVLGFLALLVALVAARRFFTDKPVDNKEQLQPANAGV